MHQDGQYWPIRPLATCTVWLAVDDSDRENGCLTVIPGSHRDRVHFRHRTRTDEDIVLNQAVDDSRAFARPPAFVELERGQLSMHDIFLIHGSAPNTSGRRRAGVAIRYMPTRRGFGATSKCRSRGIPPTSRTGRSGSPAGGRVREERLHRRAFHCAAAPRRGLLVAPARPAGCPRCPVRGRAFRRDSGLRRAAAASPPPERVR